MSLQDHDDLFNSISYEPAITSMQTSSMTSISSPSLLSMEEAYKEYLERQVNFTGYQKEAQAKLEQLKVSHPELFV